MERISNSTLGLLVHQVRSGELDREGFLQAAKEAGVPAERAQQLAGEALASWENQRRLRESPREAHDFIVIGAGSAGCVLAARLSEDPANHVLVLEAGGPGTNPDVFIPSRWRYLLGTELDWSYQTVPQRHAADRVIPCPRGKMLGGCASNNASVWVRGHHQDFDHWAARGNPGWDGETVRRIFKELEDYSGGEDEYRGVGGPLRISRAADPHPLAHAFIEGAQQAGVPMTRDYNGARMEGAGFFDLCIADGERFNVARGLLFPAMSRPNLTVLTHAEVTRLLFEGNRCTGVEFRHGGQVRRVRATREVVLSAGAINSPKMLMQSGVGPADELQALGIPVVRHLPGVGQDLQDHILVAGINYESSVPLPKPRGNGAEATLWWRSHAALQRPDIQPVLHEFPLVTPELGPVPDNGYALVPGLVRPASRGHLRLTSADPLARPIIDMNYLGHEADVEALRIAVELCREIGASRAFDGFRKRELMPGPRGRAATVEWIRKATTCFFHPTSTCRMGVDERAVVDSRLRVHGLEGLRVADASIMPEITSGPTNAPAILIGEQASRFMLAARHG
ncbi:FAD-dependent oxidoreductase [Archangium violaceum]|uniref:GMC family oxidoreductase n=1 Tax=Archangium violaceum TaxID=83451 RepID=UPI002B2C342E|nr:FAD-dependent oxidoreductase [Archangium gephyra]